MSNCIYLWKRQKRKPFSKIDITFTSTFDSVHAQVNHAVFVSCELSKVVYKNYLRLSDK